jgi:hypothetical protein
MYAEQRGRFQLSPRQDRRVQSLAVTGIAVWSRLCAVVPCRVTRDTHTSHDSTPSPLTLGASGFPPARPAALTCCASGVDDSLFGLRDSRPESRARLPVSPRESRSCPRLAQRVALVSPKPKPEAMSAHTRTQADVWCAHLLPPTENSSAQRRSPQREPPATSMSASLRVLHATLHLNLSRQAQPQTPTPTP